MYGLIWSDPFTSMYDRLDATTKQRVDDAMAAIAATPRSHRAKRLVGYERETWRWRVGHVWRIQYEIDDNGEVKFVELLSLKTRDKAYPKKR